MGSVENKCGMYKGYVLLVPWRHHAELPEPATQRGVSRCQVFLQGHAS
jgi:hypothetical protein